MSNPQAAAAMEVDDKYDKETGPDDAGSSTSETVAENVEDEKPSSSSEPPPSKPSAASWDGPDDPDNPQNWPKSKKWSLTFFSGMMVQVWSFVY